MALIAAPEIGIAIGDELPLATAVPQACRRALRCWMAFRRDSGRTMAARVTQLWLPRRSRFPFWTVVLGEFHPLPPSTCARCKPRRALACSIWLRQEKPSARTIASLHGADRRQQRLLAAGHRHLVVVGLEAEGAGEAAAAGVEEGDVEAGLGEKVAVGPHAHHRLVVAVAVDDGLAGELRRLPVRRALLEQLGEGEDVAA